MFCHQGQICKKADTCLNLYPCVIKYYLLSLSPSLSLSPPPPLLAPLYPTFYFIFIYREVVRELRDEILYRHMYRHRRRHHSRRRRPDERYSDEDSDEEALVRVFRDRCQEPSKFPVTNRQMLLRLLILGSATRARPRAVEPTQNRDFCVITDMIATGEGPQVCFFSLGCACPALCYRRCTIVLQALYHWGTGVVPLGYRRTTYVPRAGSSCPVVNSKTMYTTAGLSCGVCPVG